jgi:hypothetical protein
MLEIFRKFARGLTCTLFWLMRIGKVVKRFSTWWEREEYEACRNARESLEDNGLGT